MKVFELHGVSGSGKTTSAEQIIKELVKRGYSVGTIKNIHFDGFAMDREGTNTYRHAMAGAQLVSARGNEETDILFKRQLGMAELLTYYTQDFVISEGHSELPLPKIIAAHQISEIEERLTPLTFAVTGKLSETLKEYKGLPVINAVKEVERLVDLIENQVVDYDKTIEK
ncbi:MAG: molybdopterin-guanine dinucleotide biosynthesis protein B [Anaerovorax sp.]